ncbi:PP2C family serine/threonine-protein phosphatase [Arthrobacter sp. LAPM80]|uniref:PP2C family protein-serine/threonine phosphatase n=1 Tax=Arthrobacter sp. LAPM80 TaxID=3141788 RepID=UPI00398B8D9D
MAEYPLILRYAVRSHVGMVRAKNDDSAYAGRYLAVVADGMGGHAGGDVASASTVLDLIHLDHNHHNDDAGAHLADEIQSANSLLSELVHVNPKLAGMGTTVTALLLSGDRLAYAHIGDSRAYRLRDGVFEQLSTDHTFVQRMIDEGRMTEAEAEVHPHKNVLMRVLGDVDASPELDLKYFDAIPGDRWLLCSDGLNFVRHDMVEQVIRHTKSLASAAETLIDLTLAAGSPDNVTVVVLDIAEDAPDKTAALDTIPVPEAVSAGTGLPDSPHDGADAPLQESAGPGGPGESDTSDDSPETGATDQENAAETAPDDAGEESDALDNHIRAAAIQKELASREHELVGAALTANAEGKIPQLARHPAVQRAATVLTHKTNIELPVLVEDTEVSLPRLRQRPWVLAIVGAVTALVIIAGSWAAYAWTQTQYFVGVSNGNVAIFQGVSQSLGPISLSHIYKETGVSVTSLPEYSQQLVANTMAASTLSNAEKIISDLQLGTGTSMPPCELVATPSSTVSPSGTATVQATGTPSPPPATASPKPSGTATDKTTTTAKPAAGAPAPTATATATATCIPRGGK